MPKRLLQSFIPWVIFFLCFGYDQITLQIGASGALVALILLEKQGLERGFIFDWASLLFFVFIFVTVIVFYQPWIVVNASILANIALTAIAWISLLINKPFTMQYTRLMVTKNYWQKPLFIASNRWLTLVWAIVFTVLTVMEYVTIYHIKNNIWLAEVFPLALVLFAVWFNTFFPDWYQYRKIGPGGLINLNGLSDLKFVTTDNAEISYRTIGQGQPLLMLPAAMMTMYTWDIALIRNLAKRYKVILIDYPGVNESLIYSGEFTVEGLTHIFQEFIQKLHLTKLTLVGYSMGGWLAQWLAIHYPQSIANVVLIATDAGGARVSTNIAGMLEKLVMSKSQAQRIELLTEQVFDKKSYEILEIKLRSLYSMAAEQGLLTNIMLKQELHLAKLWYEGQGSYKDLSKIQVPTLVMVGVHDKILHRQHALLLANSLPRGKLIEYATAGHGVIYQYPVEIALEICKLLK
jgi:pimeloyl-ACP methyl ester carboxylesterase